MNRADLMGRAAVVGRYPGNMLLELEDLTITLRPDDGPERALVEGVSLEVGVGATAALVGESGSGKTLTALAILGLLREPAIRVTGGRLSFDGDDLLAPGAFARVRGARIGFVFQDPTRAFDPSFTVGRQLEDAILAHRPGRRADARREAERWLERVGVTPAAATPRRYPHQLSGGQLQRAMIAMALVHRPRLLVADEPTSSLDVGVQGQVLGLLRSLQAETGLALLLVSHDFRVVRAMAQDVFVLHQGRLVERLQEPDLDGAILHPYTRDLVQLARGGSERLGADHAASGERVPGCRFAAQCPSTEAACREAEPRLVDVGPHHAVACPPAAEGRLVKTAIEGGR